jgi:hypothetical protein
MILFAILAFLNLILFFLARILFIFFSNLMLLF